VAKTQKEGKPHKMFEKNNENRKRNRKRIITSSHNNPKAEGKKSRIKKQRNV